MPCRDDADQAVDLAAQRPARAPCGRAGIAFLDVGVGHPVGATPRNGIALGQQGCDLFRGEDAGQPQEVVVVRSVTGAVLERAGVGHHGPAAVQHMGEFGVGIHDLVAIRRAGLCLGAQDVEQVVGTAAAAG